MPPGRCSPGRSAGWTPQAGRRGRRPRPERPVPELAFTQTWARKSSPSIYCAPRLLVPNELELLTAGVGVLIRVGEYGDLLSLPVLVPRRLSDAAVPGSPGRRVFAQLPGTGGSDGPARPRHRAAGGIRGT